MHEPIKLIAFDVDGTLVMHPKNKVVWQIFHDSFVGNADIGMQRYHDFKAGRISYAKWVELDVGGWKQAQVTANQMSVLIQSELQLVANCLETLTGLKQRGYKLAIISGSLDIVLKTLLPYDLFDYCFMNQLHFDANGLLERWTPTPFDVDGKARAIEHIASQEGLLPKQCAFVGDHINDLAALTIAGFPIAFCPKHSSVSQAAKLVIEKADLAILLEHF